MAEMFNSLNTTALERVNSAIVISDATTPDCPVIYANPAFESMTGYSADEVVGRNCRFLQGRDRDQAARSIIREALADGRPIRAVLRNYKKNEQLFYNELFLDVIRDKRGRVTHFVGCQNKIDNPNEALLRQNALLGFEQLTPDEREAFRLMTSGYTNEMLAEAMGISEDSAQRRWTRVFGKFGINDITLLVRFAIALGIPFDLPAVRGAT